MSHLFVLAELNIAGLDQSPAGSWWISSFIISLLHRTQGSYGSSVTETNERFDFSLPKPQNTCKCVYASCAFPIRGRSQKRDWDRTPPECCNRRKSSEGRWPKRFCQLMTLPMSAFITSASMRGTRALGPWVIFNACIPGVSQLRQSHNTNCSISSCSSSFL